MRVINVAVTQGSRKDRQEARYAELRGACDFLGYDLIQTASNGLENVNVKTREKDRTHWLEMVQVLAKQSNNLALSSHVGLHDERLLTCSLDCLRDRASACLIVEIVDRNGGALRSKCGRDRGTDAARCARHQRHHAGQRRHVDQSPIFSSHATSFSSSLSVYFRISRISGLSML